MKQQKNKTLENERIKKQQEHEHRLNMEKEKRELYLQEERKRREIFSIKKQKEEEIERLIRKKEEDRKKELERITATRQPNLELTLLLMGREGGQEIFAHLLRCYTFKEHMNVHKKKVEISYQEYCVSRENQRIIEIKLKIIKKRSEVINEQNKDLFKHFKKVKRIEILEKKLKEIYLYIEFAKKRNIDKIKAT